MKKNIQCTIALTPPCIMHREAIINKYNFNMDLYWEPRGDGFFLGGLSKYMCLSHTPTLALPASSFLCLSSSSMVFIASKASEGQAGTGWREKNWSETNRASKAARGVLCAPWLLQQGCRRPSPHPSSSPHKNSGESREGLEVCCHVPAWQVLKASRLKVLCGSRTRVPTPTAPGRLCF